MAIGCKFVAFTIGLQQLCGPLFKYLNFNTVKKTIIISLLTLLAFMPVHAGLSLLTQNAQISLITCDPGTELYSTFGHSALRVKDTAYHIDRVYNYGTFDFNTEHFYIKFTRGKLKYQLSVSDFKNFMSEYVWENRSVYEQVLNLTQAEKDTLFYLLEQNYLPQNRYYLYDFFKDNCSTRIRDIVDEALDNKIKFDTSIPNPGQSFRDLISPCLINMPWSKLGIDIALGLPTDDTATPDEYMFLPLELMGRFKTAKVAPDDHQLAYQARTLYKAYPVNPENPLSPAIICWGLFLLALVITAFSWKKRNIAAVIFDKILFILTGITGILVVFLWFFSDHSATQYNLNLLWANPLYFFFLFRNKVSRWMGWFVSGILTFVIVAFPFLPQDLNNNLIPVILTLLLRIYGGILKKKD